MRYITWGGHAAPKISGHERLLQSPALEIPLAVGRPMWRSPNYGQSAAL